MAPEQRTEKIQLRLTPSQSAAWRAAAAHHDLKLSRWIRQHLDLAAKTLSAAVATLALKNAWAVRTELHQIEVIIATSQTPVETRRELQLHIESMREPVAFLVNLQIVEQRTS
jgi:uncharacterized protein (DUF1778 family)